MSWKSSINSSSSMPSHTKSAVTADNFEYMSLPDDIKSSLVQQISTSVEEFLDCMMDKELQDAYWRGKMHKDGTVYYEDKISVTKRQARFCCVSVTNASVEDVIGLFVVSDTDMLLRRCRIMYANIMDARVLNVLKQPSEEFPLRSAYIRYTAFKSPPFLRNRDMCVVVATDVIHCPDGSTIGYCVWDSLNFSEDSGFDVPRGFVRSRMFRSGYFVQNSGDPGAKTTIAYLVGIEAGGVAPQLAMWYVMPQFGAVLNRIVGHLQRKQLDPSTFVPQSEWTDKRTAKHCQCCSKHFGVVKVLNIRRYNCMVCGDAICHACHDVEDVEVPGARNITANVCVGCKSFPRKISQLSRWSARWKST